MNKVNKWIIALTVIFPTLIEVIDTSVVNVSLDHIRGSLSAGVDEATWAITAYLVANAIVIPLTGWLSRVFGRRNYVLFSITLFTVSSFMCGSAKSLSMLIFFRVLQGIGGGGLQPISQAILFETFPPAQYGMAMAIFGVGVLFGPIIGPLLGGWITDNWSWNWIFYINIPIGVLSIIMVSIFIKDPPYLTRIKEKIDYWGLAFIVLAVGSLQVILDKGQREDWFASAFITRLSVVSVISFILFIIIELRVKSPVLNIRQLKNISFASANAIQFVAFFGLFGSIVILPLFVQQLLGYNAFLAGFVIAPGGLATLLMMPMVGRLVTRINPKFILFTGVIVLSYSMVVMSNFNLYVDYNIILWSRIVMGVGMGMIFIPLTTMAFTTINKEEMGNATSIFNLLRNIAGSFGIAFMTTILARRSQFHQFILSEKLNVFDQRYQIALDKAGSILAQNGAYSSHAANGLIHQQLLRQANLFSFNDAFYVGAIAMLCVLPLVFLLKRPVHSENLSVPLH
ncbi:MAG: DHA2 family efflux MFS transporter permease subunit [Candidatus Omnitrophica bacterium]|jgi:DHA2 family multidrug resistance protein|nr:DHA2 family efflux MFS transporter permease subunit [Candidatus Omnitrophota bacterium]